MADQLGIDPSMCEPDSAAGFKNLWLILKINLIPAYIIYVVLAILLANRSVKKCNVIYVVVHITQSMYKIRVKNFWNSHSQF